MNTDFTIRFHTDGDAQVTATIANMQKQMESVSGAVSRSASDYQKVNQAVIKTSSEATKTEGIFRQISAAINKIVSDGRQMADQWEGARDQAMIMRQRTEEAGQAAESTAASVKRIATSFGLVFGAVASIRFAVNATLEQERAETALNAALANTGLEVDRVSQSLMGYAKELQRTTEYSDEQIISGVAMMQNMAELSEQEIPKAMKAAIGLSAVTGRDLNNAFRLLGLAAQGNTAMLSRWAIKVDESLTAEEKFNQVLEIGASRFNIAEEQAKSASGRLKQMGNLVRDLAENVAGLIIPLVKLTSTVLTPLLNILNKLPSWLWASTAAITAFVIGLYKIGASGLSVSAALTKISIGFTKVTASAITAGSAIKTFMVTIGPVGWTVLAAGAAMTAYHLATNKAAKSMGELGNSMTSAVGGAQASMITFDRLSQKLVELHTKTNRTVIEQNEYRNTINNLNKEYGGFLNNLDIEKTKREDLIGVITRQRTALQQELAANVQSAVLKSYSDKIAGYAKTRAEFSRQMTILEENAKKYSEIAGRPIAPAGNYKRLQEMVAQIDRSIKNVGSEADEAAKAVMKLLNFGDIDLDADSGRGKKPGTIFDPMLSKFQSLRDELTRLYSLDKIHTVRLHTESELQANEYQARMDIVKKYAQDTTQQNLLLRALELWNEEERTKIAKKGLETTRKDVEMRIKYLDIMYGKNLDYFDEMKRMREAEVNLMELDETRKQNLIKHYNDEIDKERLEFIRGDALIDEFRKYAMTAEQLEIDTHQKQAQRLAEQFEAQRATIESGQARNILTTIEYQDAMLKLQESYSAASEALERIHQETLDKLREKGITPETGIIKELTKTQQFVADSIEGLVYSVGNAFGRMLTEGESFASAMKDAFKSFVNSAISDISRLVARMVALRFLGSIFPGTGLALPAAEILGGLGGGDVLPSGSIASTTPRPSYPVSSPGSGDGLRALVKEVQGLRKDVYAAQPQSMRINWRKGELSRAVDIDTGSRLVMAR